MLKSDLILLKPGKFYYCDKKFIQHRFLSRDLKLFITQDVGFEYVTCYRANKDGKGIRMEDDGLFHENCSAAYPIYDVQTALDRITALAISLEYDFKIDPSHYSRRRAR